MEKHWVVGTLILPLLQRFTDRVCHKKYVVPPYIWTSPPDKIPENLIAAIADNACIRQENIWN